jgi:hypothetical protein
VRNTADKFGKNAGKIWATLNERGPMIEEDIVKATRLKDREFYSAIGWLARENKICREGEKWYKLDNTNLTPEIGANAGKIWNVMNVWGEVDIHTIKRLAEINEKEIYSAIGWLARENKIHTDGRLTRYNLR